MRLIASRKWAMRLWHCNADTKTTRHFPKSLKPENMIQAKGLVKVVAFKVCREVALDVLCHLGRFHASPTAKHDTLLTEKAIETIKAYPALSLSHDAYCYNADAVNRLKEMGYEVVALHI